MFSWDCDRRHSMRCARPDASPPRPAPRGRALIGPAPACARSASRSRTRSIAAGGGLAFPVQSSRNHMAAHYCPWPDDPTAYQAGDLAKLDLGVHVDGWVVDTALTVNVGAAREPARSSTPPRPPSRRHRGRRRRACRCAGCPRRSTRHPRARATAGAEPVWPRRRAVRCTARRPSPTSRDLGDVAQARASSSPSSRSPRTGRATWPSAARRGLPARPPSPSTRPAPSRGAGGDPRLGGLPFARRQLAAHDRARVEERCAGSAARAG